MIIVLGSCLDSASAQLVAGLAEWPAAGARLLSAEDLGRAGWAFDPADPGGGSLVAGGEILATTEVDAVLVRRPAVAAEELGWLAPPDRSYGAAELNAFLVCWLSALPCPVLNRPSPTSLAGPGWSQLHWRLAAGRVGFRWSAEPVAGATAAGTGRDVVVCGSSVHGALDSGEAGRARALSAQSGAALVGLRLHGRTLSAVTSQPSLDCAEVRALLLEQLSHPRLAR